MRRTVPSIMIFEVDRNSVGNPATSTRSQDREIPKVDRPLQPHPGMRGAMTLFRSGQFSP
jgi:hypothetical protein